MPPLMSRFTRFASLVPGPWVATDEKQVREAFQSNIRFDMAGVPFPGQIQGLMAAGVTSDRLFYGSEYPHPNLLLDFLAYEPTCPLQYYVENWMADCTIGDYPFTRAEAVEGLLKEMDGEISKIFSSEEIEKVYHKNAEKLFRS